MFKLFRGGYWPGPKPDISPDRKMCSDCLYSSAAHAGWQWDRCRHPKADYGSVVRNERPKCHDMRLSSDQCGKSAKWFTPIPDDAGASPDNPAPSTAGNRAGGGVWFALDDDGSVVKCFSNLDAYEADKNTA